MVIVQQSIEIKNLPEQFENFTILQITDLHEKKFGTNQERLLNKINSIDYDVLVFTGDLLDNPKSENFEPIYTLLEGIHNKNIAFFVPGNTDPKSYILNREYPLDKDEFIKGLEERGLLLLDSVQEVKRGSASLYFTYFENSILEEIGGEKNSVNFNISSKLQRELSVLNTLSDSDTLFALNHYPIPDKKIDELKKKQDYHFRNYDLIIAGHYHGGQIRFPFVGAIFVPDPYYLWDGLFPPRDRVKGLWEYDGVQQYVSAGLSSSDAIFFLKFRFLNSPEINVLTLYGV